MSFKFEFWVICVLAMFDKMTFPPFMQNASELLQTKFNLTMDESGKIIIYPDIVYILLSIFIALLIDKRGNKGFVLAFGFILMFVSQFIFYNLEACPPLEKCFTQ